MKNCKNRDISKLKNGICAMWWNILLLVWVVVQSWLVYECVRIDYNHVTFANWSFPPLCVYGYSGETHLSTTCYEEYNTSMAPFLVAREIGASYRASRDISFFFTMSILWPLICIVIPLAIFMDKMKTTVAEILDHIDTQMMSGVTQGIVYVSVRSVDDDMDTLYKRLRASACLRNIRFAIDKRLPECEGTRSYAISWATDKEPPNVDTKPHIIAGGRQGELIQRLLDMLHWYEAEGYVSDDWSDDITETTI